ncbi:MAG TPA: tetratricopeptide repeat protein [Allosphingosinicella sp.]|nr:tetratricopeptide repeat protein [Allosphingosinicella sp.]
MAIKPKENEAFYREVDDELRRDRALETWERYRWPIIGGIVLLIAAIGGFIWWQNHRESRAQAQGEALTAVVEGMQTGAYRGTAPRIAELEKSGNDMYRGLGLISRANLLAQEGDTAGAARVLAQVAADGSVPEEVRNAALVRQTIIEYERLQPAQVVQRLRPLVQRGNPFHGTAGELTAHAHLRAQQAQQAGQVFKAIAEDDTVPESIRSRAVQMAGGLGIDATQVAPASGGGGAAPGGNAPAAPAPAAAPAAPATKE